VGVAYSATTSIAPGTEVVAQLKDHKDTIRVYSGKVKHLLYLLLGCLLYGMSNTPPVEATESSHTLHLLVRDTSTGARLQSRLFLHCGDSSRTFRLSTGEIRVRIPAQGRCEIRVASPGYRSLETSFDTAHPLPLSFWLDPSTGKRKSPDHGNLLRGFVYDEADGSPIAGALVSLENRGLGTITDRNGYFEIPLELPQLPPEELPELDILRISAAGYTSTRREDFLGPGVQSLIIDLRPGRGTGGILISHHFLLPEADSPESPENEDAHGEKALSHLDPPSTIKVGTSCSCTSCSGVSVMSLETYVRMGLNDEWIASWADESLRAGAVAYRSYGAYYVQHPIDGTYDICSSTCCQVNDTDTSSATDSAGSYTAGFMLQKSGLVFRAEYSAENNAWDDPADGLSCSNTDLSCGDGHAGSPDADWSCISDSLCAGHGCFGHGRGMCQWGTQRLASTGGETWTEIVDHYYNDNGAGTGQRTAQMSTPLYIESVSAISPTFSSFEIPLIATSTTESDHEHIMVGASLYSPATGYISDPPNDLPVTVSPGDNSLRRSFDIPQGTAEGIYDLYVSLYFDVNGDGAISTADKALDLAFIEDAVTISAAIFSDGFESGDCSRWSGQVEAGR